jgi:hypothetical protein
MSLSCSSESIRELISQLGQWFVNILDIILGPVPEKYNKIIIGPGSVFAPTIVLKRDLTIVT